ncbi:MAG TPA: MerR family transcriptional regulator [Bryobacteraceae bacterium]|nr:MerR family transcriptional regulator [Bryobacteraceae bacterium]
MVSVTELARSCGLSRSTVLYYESVGLLRPAGRTSSRYRRYGEAEVARLRQICAFRDAGLTLSDIRLLLEQSGSSAAGVLERRLGAIAAEIERLRDHQRSLLALLKHKSAIRRARVMTKEKWVSIMHDAGFSEADMHRWHTEFEKAAPEDHDEFLRYLKITDDEVGRIRAWSRTA